MPGFIDATPLGITTPPLYENRQFRRQTLLETLISSTGIVSFEAMAPSVDTLPEILFSRRDQVAESRRVLRLAADKVVRRIVPGVYTSNLTSPLENVVLRKWTQLVAHLVPDALVSHRSAFDGGPRNGVLVVSSPDTRRKIELPGLVIDVVPGAPALTDGDVDDLKFVELHISGPARRYLENLTRGRGWAPRVLSPSEMETTLEQVANVRGATGLNQLRDQACQIAPALGLEREAERLDRLIGTLQGTRKSTLATATSVARSRGNPYDANRVDLFTTLFEELNKRTFPVIPEATSTPAAKDNFGFFEAYFSNYIEGTEFTVEEAESIVFKGVIIPNRDADSHDVLGTYEAATRSPWRDRLPADVDSFLEWLRLTHALIMERRPAALPGQWKTRLNQAGSTIFVIPDLVVGTLREGFSRLTALADPLARALMMMIIVSEVHPFADGNGRTARLAMNSILSAEGRCRIIVPTISRGNYLQSLKAFSAYKHVDPYIRVMSGLNQWSAGFDYTRSVAALTERFRRIGVFEDEAELNLAAMLAPPLDEDEREDESSAGPSVG